MLGCGCSATVDRAAHSDPAGAPPPSSTRHALDRDDSDPKEPAPLLAKEGAPRDGGLNDADAKRAEGDDRPRMGSIDAYSNIYAKPERHGLPLGYIRMGTSVPLLSQSPVPGRGCPRGWYAVAPRGFACLDETTTLDLSDSYFRGLATVAPKQGIWPYRYAFSNGAPMYSRVPTAEEQERLEKKFGPRRSFVQLAEWSKGHEELLSNEPIQATDPVPEIFAGGKRRVPGGKRNTDVVLWRTIPNGSMLSYAKAFEVDGRVWLLTPDLMLVPADRVRAIRRSTFHGTSLKSGVELPLAWNRAWSPKPTYRRDESGAAVATGTTIAPKTFVAVRDNPVTIGKRTYFEVTASPGTFVVLGDVTVSRARGELPRGVQPGSKWIEAKILPGTLTAYEGMTPVYATLFSPGKGGAPVPGYDPYIYSMTRTGVFPIEWKDRVATMSPDKGAPTMLWFSDVPHIQYLRAPLAMHVSFWHEDFGNLKSAECVNVSPLDGDWLFDWTDPKPPEGWAGIRPGGGNGPSTPVVITAM
jgi:hypothetical protein